MLVSSDNIKGLLIASDFLIKLSQVHSGLHETARKA